MNMDHPNGNGMDSGPVSPDNYKRAVYHPPPSRFSVEMLPPAKYSGSYSFGMYICSITRGERSSVSSRGSISEYEIWRRWEDCLYFQEALETEYRRLARMKRQRLKDGKGVKKGGFYKQDMAASFESLPPGPDPHSVAQDIHDHLPRLNKKGTVFRASQATIDQRHAELKAFVEALMRDDVPALLLELRSDRLVTDFFGYWRRDYDLAQKQQRPVSSKGRSSISGSSMFSAYFASSNGSNADLDSDSTSKSESASKRRPSRESSGTPSKGGKGKRPHTASNASLSVPPSIVESQRLRALSTTSSDSSTPSSSSRSSGSSFNLSNPHVAGDSPLVFGHHPDHPDHPSSLQSLPEVREPSVKYDANGRLVASGGRIRGNSTGDIQGHPSSIKPVGVPTGLQSNTQASRNNPVRESWQTTASAATYLEGLNLSFTGGVPSELERSRMSVSSFATFMTDSSADAIIPRTNSAGMTVPHSGLHRSLSAGSHRRMRPVSVQSVTESELWSDTDDELVEGSLYGSFPLPSFHLPSSLAHWRQPIESGLGSRPETPTGHTNKSDAATEMAGQASSANVRPLERPVSSGSIMSHFPISLSEYVANEAYPHIPNQEDNYPPPSPTTSVMTTVSSTVFTADSESMHSDTDSTAPASPTTSTAFSVSTASTVRPSTRTSIASAGPVITIKAAHNKSIIVVRVDRDTEFQDIRKRIYDKFVNQEDVPLSNSFSLAFVVPGGLTKSSVGSGQTRGRSSSLSSSGGIEMNLVLSQGDWDCVVGMTEGNKIALRVLDTFSQTS